MAPRARLTAALTSHADVDSPSRAGLNLWSHDAKRRRGTGVPGKNRFWWNYFRCAWPGGGRGSGRSLYRRPAGRRNIGTGGDKIP